MKDTPYVSFITREKKSFGHLSLQIVRAFVGRLRRLQMLPSMAAVPEFGDTLELVFLHAAVPTCGHTDFITSKGSHYSHEPAKD